MPDGTSVISSNNNIKEIAPAGTEIKTVKAKNKAEAIFLIPEAKLSVE